ncbi:hypothetical protein ACH4Y0_37120 [Streptomyces sp. NPDC020707]|uniref:hypothetical protein n=1 Tax=Streptomyces sp. NPDC020707 TaxID=3365084 RepID=UPI0037A5EF51
MQSDDGGTAPGSFVMPAGTEPVRDRYALALDPKTRGGGGDGDHLRARTNSSADAFGDVLSAAHGRP